MPTRVPVPSASSRGGLCCDPSILGLHPGVVQRPGAVELAAAKWRSKSFRLSFSPRHPSLPPMRFRWLADFPLLHLHQFNRQSSELDKLRIQVAHVLHVEVEFFSCNHRVLVKVGISTQALQ